MIDNSTIRRLVWIMVDGVSAAKIRSCCTPEENAARNPNMPLTFFDELAEKSFVATNAICSGPYTQASLGAQFTGLSSFESGLDAHYKYSKFLKDKTTTIPSRLKQNGWHTYFVTNDVSWIHRHGVGDNPTPLFGFETIDIEQCAWGLVGNEGVELWKQDAGKSLLFVHDYFQHNHPQHNTNRILTTKMYE